MKSKIDFENVNDLEDSIYEGLVEFFLKDSFLEPKINSFEEPRINSYEDFKINSFKEQINSFEEAKINSFKEQINSFEGPKINSFEDSEINFYDFDQEPEIDFENLEIKSIALIPRFRDEDEEVS